MCLPIMLLGEGRLLPVPKGSGVLANVSQPTFGGGSLYL